jgi:hypothetical protein
MPARDSGQVMCLLRAELMAIEYTDIALADSHRAENKGRGEFETGFAPASPILLEEPI